MSLLGPPMGKYWVGRIVVAGFRGVVKLSTTNSFGSIKKVALQIGVEIIPMLARDMERSDIRRKVDEPIGGRSSVKHKKVRKCDAETWMCLD